MGLLDQDEQELQQCARVDWLTLEDANRTFFTKKSRETKLHNTLLGNINVDGSLVTTREELGTIATSSFKELFQKNQKLAEYDLTLGLNRNEFVAGPPPLGS